MRCILVVVSLLLCSNITLAGDEHQHHTQDHTQDHSQHGGHVGHAKHQAMLKNKGKASQVENQTALPIPNVELINQDGKKVKVLDDVIQNKIVVINTIFTTCTTICPVMGLQYAQIQKQLAKNPQLSKNDIHLISISIDPLNDTPKRLREFKQKFGGQDGWTLLTGSQRNIEHILKLTGLFAADPQEHSPITLVGQLKTNHWKRLSGLGPAKQIVKMIAQVAKPQNQPQIAAKPSKAQSSINAAEQYFTNVELVNQHGQNKRFYQDLIKDKAVIIHSFFSTCKGSCPVSMKLMAGVQERFQEKMGKDLHIISISLDPQTDNPIKLQSYAKELGIGQGWDLISGKQENVDFILKKLGHYVSDIDAHKNTILIGKEATGLWKKAFLLAKPKELDTIIQQVIDDELPTTAAR